MRINALRACFCAPIAVRSCSPVFARDGSQTGGQNDRGEPDMSYVQVDPGLVTHRKALRLAR